MGIKHFFYKRLLISLCFLAPFFLNAQTAELDSLEQSLEKRGLNAQTKIRIYDDLSWGYLNVDIDKSVFFAQKGIKLAEEEKDIPMVITLYRNLGVAYYMVSKYDSARTNLDTALDLALEIKDEVLQ